MQTIAIVRNSPTEFRSGGIKGDPAAGHGACQTSSQKNTHFPDEAPANSQGGAPLANFLNCLATPGRAQQWHVINGDMTPMDLRKGYAEQNAA